jgi:hypothetical protein
VVSVRISVYQIRDQGMPDAIGISDGICDVKVLKADVKCLIEMLEVVEKQR